MIVTSYRQSNEFFYDEWPVPNLGSRGGGSCLNRIQRYLDALISVAENARLFIAFVNIRVAM